MSTLTAGASSHLLIDKLAKAGWGNLAGPEFRGVRAALAELTRMLDPRSGEGKATVFQLAERTGYTTRWTGRCLHVLEELELIEWHRGGVVAGKPVPSWFRVSKRALLILLSIARDVEKDRHAEQRTKTRERIARYRLIRSGRGRKRRSVHVEVSTTLLSIKEVPAPQEAREPQPEASREAVERAVAAARQAIRAARGSRTGRAQGQAAATSEPPEPRAVGC